MLTAAYKYIYKILFYITLVIYLSFGGKWGLVQVHMKWDASNYPNGVYFFKLIVMYASAPLSIIYSETKKMILLK